MTAVLAGMIFPGLSAVPRRLCPVHRHSLEARLVREEDATALVADVILLRAARGHDVTVAPDRIVWLVRGAAVMLGAFGPGPGPTTEDNDA